MCMEYCLGDCFIFRNLQSARRKWKSIKSEIALGQLLSNGKRYECAGISLLGIFKEYIRGYCGYSFSPKPIGLVKCHKIRAVLV